MNIRLRAAFTATLSSLALGALAAPVAHANVFSVLPGSCGSQPESQPFARWGDTANYVQVPGGSFEAGSPLWTLAGGAKGAPGNETFYVRSSSDKSSLALPGGGSGRSIAACTSIYHP